MFFTPPPPPSKSIQIDWNNPEETKKRVSFKKTDYAEIYKAPVMEVKISETTKQLISLSKIKYTNMVSSIKEIQNLKYKFQISAVSYYDDYNGWSFYDSAYTDEGMKLNFTSTSRNVFKCDSYGCILMEAFTIDVPISYVESHLGKNIGFQVSGEEGGTYLFLPAGYVEGLLSTIPKNN